MLDSPITDKASWDSRSQLRSLEMDSHTKGPQNLQVINWSTHTHPAIRHILSGLSLISHFSASKGSFLFVPVCIARGQYSKIEHHLSYSCPQEIHFSHFLDDGLFSLHKYLCALPLLLILLVSVFQIYVFLLSLLYRLEKKCCYMLSYS